MKQELNQIMTFIFQLRRTMLILSLFILVPSLASCSSLTPGEVSDTPDTSSDYISGTDFLLNTVITIQLYDKQEEAILEGCFDLIAKYEDIFSRTNETSELYALNNRTAAKTGDGYVISDELSDVISKALYYCKLSEGAFDITIEPVSSLWNFTASTPVVPNAADIQAALPFVGYENIKLEENKLTFASPENGIDLGAVAKGYIADRVKDYLLEQGVGSAMINLGGNVLCVGTKPDGTPFHVGIQRPFADRNETIAIMDIDGLSVVSSGIYERYFEAEGTLYHHILNPDTGYSYENNLVSVTIISKLSVDGDCLSTTCFALGLDKGLELIAGIPDIYAVFITSDDQIYYSEGFQEAFKINEQ